MLWNIMDHFDRRFGRIVMLAIYELGFKPITQVR